MTSAIFAPFARLLLCTTAVGLSYQTVESQASDRDNAARILTESGVRGGLIVHIGCGDGTLTTSLRVDEGFLVYGLDTDPANVAKTRARIRALGLHGVVTADTFNGKTLPLADNVVNLIVAADLGDVPMTEVRRVLVPNGVAYIHGAKTVKPRPSNIDDWTHYLHDASNNAVAHDDVVGPPRHMQWQCGPRWSRHHDHMSSISAMVTAGGRVFSILDEGSRLSPQLSPNWQLVARDAFNGVLLWKQPIAHWFNALWPLKSGPASLPRRLVAIGDVVYVTLGINAPVTALDAATGNPLQTYAGTEGAEEVIYRDGMLVVLVNRTPMDPNADLASDVEQGKSRDSRTTYSDAMKHIWAGVRSSRWANSDRSIFAVDATSGRMLWSVESRVIPLTLAADATNVYFHDGTQIAALNRATGQRVWTSEPVPVWQGLQGQGLQSWFAPTLVAQDGKVVFAGGEKMHMSYMGWGSKDIGEDTMTAFDAATGKKLWTAPHPYSGYNSPEDLFVTGGKVWTGRTTKGGPDGRYFGRDLNTGKLDIEFPPTVQTHWFHHRCYRAKATDRFVLCSRNGIELVDLKTGDWTINHWVRGGCLYGIMPANGLIYSPPHPCACYPEAKLNGFTALAGKSSVPSFEPGANDKRLQRGPAYDRAGSRSSTLDPRPVSDWPMYRHDAARSGATSAHVPTALKPIWQTVLGGKLTQPITGGGLVFVADSERHLVHAIKIATGERQWTFHAGGRVDSSPTYSAGHLVFGSADGYVYCLRVSDGELAWRFRAAPIDLRMVAFEQLESVWPVHGSVLVQDGVVACVAGRSMYLDGGLHVCRIELETGRLLSEQTLDDRDPETGDSLQIRVKGLNMPVALPDILSSDGTHLFMRSQVMDLEGNRLALGPDGSGQSHLFAPYGFTDDSWFHRTYWIYGDSFKGGVGGFGNGKTNPAGRILVNDKSTIFGYGRKPEYYRWGSVIDYQLFAVRKPGGVGAESSQQSAATSGAAKRRGKSGRSKRAAIRYVWTCDVPLFVRAMALAGNSLLIAGPQDLLDEDATFQTYGDEMTAKQLRTQDVALRGETGGVFQVIDAGSGKTLAKLQLDSPPVFDGMSVAAERVFLTTMAGRIICFGE